MCLCVYHLIKPVHQTSTVCDESHTHTPIFLFNILGIYLFISFTIHSFFQTNCFFPGIFVLFLLVSFRVGERGRFIENKQIVRIYAKLKMFRYFHLRWICRFTFLFLHTRTHAHSRTYTKCLQFEISFTHFFYFAAILTKRIVHLVLIFSNWFICILSLL